MVSLFFIALFKIIIKGSVDINKQRIVVDIYIFKVILVMKLVIFESNGNLYYQINKGDIKELKINFNENMVFPKICISNLYINVVYPVGVGITGVVITYFVDVVIKVLNEFQGRLKIDGYKLNCYPTGVEDLKMNFNLIIGLEIFKMIFNYLGELWNMKKKKLKV